MCTCPLVFVLQPFLDEMGAVSLGLQVRVAFKQEWEKGAMAGQKELKSQARARALGGAQRGSEVLCGTNGAVPHAMLCRAVAHRWKTRFNASAS